MTVPYLAMANTKESTTGLVVVLSCFDRDDPGGDPECLPIAAHGQGFLSEQKLSGAGMTARIRQAVRTR